MLAGPRRRPVPISGTRWSWVFWAGLCISFCALLAILIYFVFIPTLFPNLGEAYRPVDESPVIFRNLSSRYPEFGPIGNLPDSFLQGLYDMANRVDPIEMTRSKHVIFTLFNSDSVLLAINLFCSSSDAGVGPRNHVFIALDRRSFKKMKQQHPSPLLLDCSRYSMFLLNFLVQYQLLLWNFESTICDPDTIFLSNPSNLLRSDSHFCVATTDRHTEVGLDFDYASFDFGFFHAAPSDLLVPFYHSWMKAAVATGIDDAATIFKKMLRPRRARDRIGSIQLYDLGHVGGSSRELRLRWLDPLDVVNAVLLHRNAAQTRRAAEARLMRRPVVIRLTGIKKSEKKAVITECALWYFHTDTCDPFKVAPAIWG
jgi:hypothetical protein